MHSTKSYGGKIGQLLALTVIVMLAISCGPKKVEDHVIKDSGTWQIDKYQIFQQEENFYSSNRSAKIHRNFGSMGQLQFNGDNSAVFSFDSFAVPFHWEKRMDTSEVDYETTWQVLNFSIVDTPTTVARKIPFVKHNLNHGVNTFRVLTLEKDFIYLRYRHDMNIGRNDSIHQVDVYLRKE